MYDPGTLYVDPILTGFSVGFKDQSLYGDQIMPITQVNTPSGRYRVFDRSDWVSFASRREPGTVANEVRGRKWTEDTFLTKEHSLQAAILDEERQELYSQGGLADPVFGGALQIQPEADATKLVTRSLMLEHESKVSTLIRNTANYPATNKVTLAGAQQWDDYAFVTPLDVYSVVSDPVMVIRQAIIAIWTLTRRYPNTLVIPRMGIPWIENHPRIVERFKYLDLTAPDAFTRLTGFAGQILLVDSLQNTAASIDDPEVVSSFWGKDVWLGIVDQAPGILTQTFGKTFAQVYPDGTTKPTDRWREENRKADLVRTSFKYDLKIVSAIAGYLITNAFSSSAF
jgi:hypothetical protein